MELISNMWVDKYRPQTLEDVVLSESNKQLFDKFKTENSIPNLMLVGHPGIGKSTIAKVLVKSVLQCTYLYINASDESGVDTIRHKVVNFANTYSFDGKIKVVILDECLDENTLVWILRNGEVIKDKIKDLNQDTDLVKSYDIKNNQIVWRPFDLIDQGHQDVYKVLLDNGEAVVCTENHKWYVPGPDNTPVIMKLKDIISNNIQHILSI